MTSSRPVWLKATEWECQVTTGKRAERTKRDFRCSICRSAIGKASCSICTHRRQLLFPFYRQISLKKVNNFKNPSRRYNNKNHVNNSVTSSTIKSKIRIARANGLNVVECYMLCPFAHHVARCCAKFETGQTCKSTTPNISFILWSEPVGSVKRAVEFKFLKKPYGLYPSRDALRVPTLLGVVASVCIPSPTRTQQLQHCWANNVEYF